MLLVIGWHPKHLECNPWEMHPLRRLSYPIAFRSPMLVTISNWAILKFQSIKMIIMTKLVLNALTSNNLPPKIQISFNWFETMQFGTIKKILCNKNCIPWGMHQITGSFYFFVLAWLSWNGWFCQLALCPLKLSLLTMIPHCLQYFFSEEQTLFKQSGHLSLA